MQISDADTGKPVDVKVFVVILGASQLTYFEATYYQQKEDFITSCENRDSTDHSQMTKPIVKGRYRMSYEEEPYQSQFN